MLQVKAVALKHWFFQMFWTSCPETLASMARGKGFWELKSSLSGKKPRLKGTALDRCVHNLASSRHVELTPVKRTPAALTREDGNCSPSCLEVAKLGKAAPMGSKQDKPNQTF